MEPRVLHEDDWIVVVEKPPGMVVNRATSVRGETLQDWIHDHFRFPLSFDARKRNGVVHRLDKETSGVLVVAKTEEVFGDLQGQFSRREVEKTYLALVHGKVEPREGQLSLPLARSPSDRQRFTVAARGRKASTRWTLRESFRQVTKSGVNTKSYNGFTLLAVMPETGRTHQIRVHLSHLSHPVVGDEKYAGKRAKEDRKWCPRQFLHAWRLAFSHPGTGKRVHFTSRLPSDLSAALACLS